MDTKSGDEMESDSQQNIQNETPNSEHISTEPANDQGNVEPAQATGDKDQVIHLISLIFQKYILILLQRERGSGWMEKYRDEDSENPRWRRHKKHFFMVSSAGKPIFSRYGDEEKLNPIFGVMCAYI